MKNFTLIAAPVLALCLATVSSDATPIVTGNVVNSGQLMSGQNLNSGQTQGPNVKVYLENLDLTLSSNLSVNRIGPDFGNFTNSGSGGGVIPMGTTITDYLLHYDNPGTSNNNNATGTVTFDGTIIGLIVFTTALDNSDSILGISGVHYSNDQYRGLDDSAINGGAGNDGFSVSGDQLTFNINAWTTTNVVDEVRVIVAVPDGGSTVALLGLSLGLLGILGWRKTILA